MGPKRQDSFPTCLSFLTPTTYAGSTQNATLPILSQYLCCCHSYYYRSHPSLHSCTGLLTGLSFCPCLPAVYSQYSSKRDPFKTQVRSLPSFTLNPPTVPNFSPSKSQVLTLAYKALNNVSSVPTCQTLSLSPSSIRHCSPQLPSKLLSTPQGLCTYFLARKPLPTDILASLPHFLRVSVQMAPYR